MGRRTIAAVTLGVVLLVGGLVVAVQPRPLGWTAYTPLSQASLSPGAIVLDLVGITALTLAGLGIAAIAGSVGYWMGRRAGAQGTATVGDT